MAKKKVTGKVEKPTTKIQASRTSPTEIVVGNPVPDVAVEEGMKVKVKGTNWESIFLSGATEVVFEVDGKAVVLTEAKIREM